MIPRQCIRLHTLTRGSVEVPARLAIMIQVIMLRVMIRKQRHKSSIRYSLATRRRSRVVRVVLMPAEATNLHRGLKPGEVTYLTHLGLTPNSNNLNLITPKSSVPSFKNFVACIPRRPSQSRSRKSFN